MVEIILLQMLFAASTPINKLLLVYAQPIILAAIRLLISGILIGVSMMFASKKLSFHICLDHIGLFVQKIFLGTYLKYMLKYWGLQFMSPFHMGLLLLTTPFWTAFFNYIYFNIVLHPHQWFGIVVSCFGVVPFVLVQSTHSVEPLASFYISLPALAIIGAVAAHSYGIICTQKLIKHHGYSALSISTIGSLGASILFFMTAIIQHEAIVVHDAHIFWPLLALLICTSNIIGKIWHTRLLATQDTVMLALSEYLLPFFIAIYSAILFNTALEWHHLFASFFILLGIWIFKKHQ